MTLFIFKYALPALLGYTLFVGIAGKFNPLSKPKFLEERPSWMLGLWTGMSVFVVLSIGLHMAYGMTIDEARSLLAPSAICIALLLGFGFIGYSRYRAKVHAELDALEQQVTHRDEPGINWSHKVGQLDPIIGASSPTVVLAAPAESNGMLLVQNELKKERELRIETELHLRITRKALSNTSELEPARALETPVSYSALNASRQQDDLELSVTTLKRELIAAKHEVRQHVAARAKALSTANKSVAFARQSIELRARLESELQTAHEALAIRQTTIASLISRLERERRLTDDELAALANHAAVNDSKLTPDYPDQQAAGFETKQDLRFTSGS